MKQLFSIAFFFLFSLSWAQVKSPEEYLGHQVGAKITPHWKLLEYYKYVASQVPDKIKFEQYGTSVEGRPLYAFFISSEKNIARLEEIRLNNLRLAKLTEGDPTLSDMPAIVWMSNNVHGNETSSAEASMMTLYQLVNPNNAKTKAALANTLIVIDPCLNPDGTERYNNWQNGVLGTQFYPDLYAREHQEPWPGGRINHYYFDLNRDWAWQTQVESEQRLALYNKWLPHIHVDFHEQGVNSPYYFPPAAEPFHEVITPWQREFQGTIGKHNAQYFDQQGWLYFTKERFDLFYPSYGDTYPIYSGAIGMTYEKAGNGSAGLGIYTSDKDTLTLVDRALQHHASGLNVVEVVSGHADKVVAEFKKFHTDAVEGRLSSYHSYILKYEPKHELKIRALLQLLDKNKIQYYSASGAVKGLDYFSKRNESYTIKNRDVVIPGNQSKAALVRVLFEPEAKLTDSVTYDITAWSLPYVYGVPALASTGKVAKSADYKLPTVSNTVIDGFGYAFKWNGFASAQLLAALLKEKVSVKTSEIAFKLNGEEFPSGSVILMAGANKNIDFKKIVKQQADKFAVTLHPINSGIVDGAKDLGSSDVKSVKAPKVMMLAGEEQRALNVGEVWHYFDRQLEYPIVLVNPKNISRVKWDEIDVFIMPTGNYSFLKEKAQSEAFANWIRGGGKVIAIGNAVNQVSSQGWSNIKAVKQDSVAKAKESPLRAYADRERDALKEYTAGAIYKVDFDKTHPLFFGTDNYFTLKESANLFQYFTDNKGWNVGYIKENSLMSGFVGQNLSKQMKNGLVFGTESVGAGTVIYLVDNVLFRNFWESGKLLMANAVFLVN
ncbi:M14 metallopeptidase family protein [Sphingobacterium wenxiniae]|uniref:Zinc carboxypeptidase n=1 Tax=Sphingobacterium wenxiniae TaxID=683125 RepID=A0A1I6RB28_9SPHI|nr:M14 metallopeptidase family protein [Sphingobacterium wenxiniae]SFS61876.1 Zinc carboxypeptidase [Sphingobacterium wenxiniae]